MVDDIREFPAREIALQQLQQLLKRHVDVHFHYTGGVDAYYNYAGQFADMFPELMQDNGLRQHLSHSFLADYDHVAFLCEQRHELVHQVCRHVVDSFTRAPA